MIDFNGEISDYNELYWATASERNARHFELEVSNDGKNWEHAGDLIGIYNTLGQEITGTEKGVQIYLYSNGSTRRVFKH